MKIFQVYRDGYDGSGITDSYWFDKAKAKQRRDEKQKTDPDTISSFEWEVIDRVVSDFPEITIDSVSRDSHCEADKIYLRADGWMVSIDAPLGHCHDELNVQISYGEGWMDLPSKLQEQRRQASDSSALLVELLKIK